tara:strand:+ start:758 stop:1555 length:798 start_codon:yes stop_codon:yes gene_type:complete
MLKYSKANAKTEALSQVDELKPYLDGKRKIYSLDLLSGYTCPFAKACLSKAVTLPTGKRKIKDGPDNEFRCFSASQEVQYTNVYNSRKHNMDTLRRLHLNDMIHRLNQDMPENLGICRIHVAGDFFTPDYMFAWINMAMMHQDRLFYAYTKSLTYWVKYREWIDQLDNFVLTASYGGRNDHLIATEGLRSAMVVFSEEEAERIGAEIDHDDSHAARPSLKNQSFALLIHGTQPKGSEASEALKALKGKGSYSRKKGLTLEEGMVQ